MDKKRALGLLVEQTIIGTYWYGRVMNGIYEQANKKAIEINLIKENLLTSGDFQRVLTDDPVIIVPASINWFDKVYCFLQEAGIRSILICTDELKQRRDTSIISLDYEDSTIDIINYLVKSGRQRIAYFACNPRSLVDKIKLSGFLTASKLFDLAMNEEDVFFNRGCIKDCLDIFCKKINGYDGVICSNDVSAIALMRAAAEIGIKIPGDMYVVGFGDTIIGRFINPSLTTASLDYYNVGRQAVENYIELKKNTKISSQVTTLKCVINTRASTEFREAGRYFPPYLREKESLAQKPSDTNFYMDKYVDGILRLESMFQNMDDIDNGILKGIIEGQTYNMLTGSLNISESTVKYRTKKMLHCSGTASRQELLKMLNASLGEEALASFLSAKSGG